MKSTAQPQGRVKTESRDKEANLQVCAVPRHPLDTQMEKGRHRLAVPPAPQSAPGVFD